MANGVVPPDVAPSDPLARGREALSRHAWQDAYDAFSEADHAGGLTGADLEDLAEAAFFVARPSEVTEARERAYKSYLAEGDETRAAFLALEVSRGYLWTGQTSIASAWFRRGERLLEGRPETYAHGYLAIVGSDLARLRGDIDAALALAEDAVAIGDRTRDAELQAWGRTGLGTLRIAKGMAPDGLALLEEASIAAVNGELSPFASGIICCTMISACRDLTDYQRAGEWIEATDRYCQRQSVAGFPGACRIHRAEIVALGGGWERAEQELQQATAELERFDAGPPAADGYYALGDVRRLRGDLEGAETALRQAHALGRSPYPALALVRLAEGKVKAAGSAIEAALADEAPDRWARIRLLPARVEIALAAGDGATARAAAEELGELVAAYPSPAFDASSLASLGRVLLAEGDASGAARELRSAIRRWREVPNPYEIARSRLRLGEALGVLGDDEDAELELRAARDEFHRLGARLELEEAEAMARRRTEGLAAPVQVRRTFMFTDIVGSTRLAEALGDEAWERLLAWHDRTLRGLVVDHGGSVASTTGDGFFVAFHDARQAIDCAIAIERALAEHRSATGFALDVRIGLHAAEANERGSDYSGVGVHVAARVAALAERRMILATAATLEEAGVTGHDARDVELKGVSGTVAVASVAWDR